MICGLRQLRDNVVCPGAGHRVVRAATLILALAAIGCSDPAVQKQRYLESGNRYAGQGDLQAAVIEYRNAIQIDPKFSDARVKLAETYARLGDGNNALKEYVRAADLLPDNAELQLTAGSYLLAAGQMDSALARADNVLGRQPDNVAGHILRGSALGGLEELDQALSAVEEAVRLDPKRSASYTQLGLVEFARGKTEPAEAALKKAVELDPRSIGAHLALGNFYWSLGRRADTQRAFESALQLEPRHVSANRAMALLSMATGQLERAEKHLKQVAEISKTPAAQFALSDFYVATNRAKDAVTLLTPLAADSRRVAGARNRLAAAVAASGDRARAHGLLDAILKEDPRDAQAQIQKGLLLLEDGKSDQALASMQAAVAAEPASATSQFALGRVYATRGDFAGAEKAFQEVVRLNPRATVARVELSKLQLASARPQESLTSAETAVKDQPQSLEVRLTLVRSLTVTRDYQRAEREMQSLLREYPQHARVHVQQGVLAGAQSQIAAARASFDRALTLDSGSIDALTGLIALDLSSRNFASAKQRIEQRLQAGTTDGAVLLLAARTYASANDLAASESMLRRVLEVSPALLPAYSMLGQLYLKQGKLDEARKEFDALAERESKPVAALTMSGTILLTQGNTALAKQRFERAVSLDSHAAVAANNLAWLYAESNENLERAVMLAVSASQVMPESPEVLDTLGWVYVKNNLPTLAVPPLVRAVEKNPGNPTYSYHLGLAYEKAGDHSQSRRSLEKALALKADFAGAEDARRALARAREATGQ
jgi:putative PEP-CTERM system TPR-repeat lipoprotein